MTFLLFYRTPAPAVAPPTVPGQYAAMPQQRVSGYAPGLPPPQGMTHMQQMPGGMTQTPVGMARPMSQTSAPPSPGIMFGMPDGGPPRFRASHMPQQASLGMLLKASVGPGQVKMCLMPYANNKGADQPAHPRSLISTFVVRYLDSMTCILAISKVSRF